MWLSAASSLLWGLMSGFGLSTEILISSFVINLSAEAYSSMLFSIRCMAAILPGPQVDR